MLIDEASIEKWPLLRSLKRLGHDTNVSQAVYFSSFFPFIISSKEILYVRETGALSEHQQK